MDYKEESNMENSNRYRKFGLPNWMVNNIERLNFVTDFEQYACSPPETEGFLSEHPDNCDFHDDSEPFCPVVIPNDPVEEKPNLSLEINEGAESKSSSQLLRNSAEPVSPTFAILNSLKHEEFYSSPDSTPCATPEPSPAPRRKMSGQQDTVHTNPGRWFYLGNGKKGDPIRGQCLVTSNKENRRRYSDKCNESPVKVRDQSVKPKKDSIKLVISNFDINAISPSSW